MMRVTLAGAAPLSIQDMLNERRDHGDEPLWIGLSSSACLHDQCDEGVALRRFYEGVQTPDGVFIVAHMAIVLWTLVFLSGATFPLEDIKNKRFRFAINTENGSWVRGTDDAEA